MRISVLGTGYLGATHAACLAREGYDVVAVDCDPRKVASLAAGRAPFREDGLDDLLRAGIDAGRLCFTTDLHEAAGADVHFLCVGTPETTDPPGRLDLSALWGLVDDLAPLLRRPCLLVGRSTVPAGTAREVRDRVQRSAPAGPEVSVAWNPEFLREGHAVADSVDPHRIVVGTEDAADLVSLREVYRPWLDRDVPFVTTDLATAELAKVSANAMLATRISMVNVLAELCEQAGADVDGLVEVLGGDPRIGRDYLEPGLGFGGSCLPKDLRGLTASAQDAGLAVAADFLRQVDRVNDHQRSRTVALATDLLGGDVRGRRIAVLGAAFKAGSDDLRESPAVDVAGRLAGAGATVLVHDPAAHDVPSDRPWQLVATAAEACTDAELVLVLTPWPEYADLDPARLRRRVRFPRVIDARRALDRERWQQAGWQHWAPGVDAATLPADHRSVATA
ncbi:nucleotide sugar dehydrogenase [Nocardioides sp. TF02-7]|uniref:UDP-glucose dehydrogenase family protein n=1 Tax=Nocardioides sp. TF02-7 TaxID=2917724 RepID=UPI001F06E275|nr:nucleotide sugar dehydrogenase [Nocardioides sp. TF02-7]UMG93657.1 UDP-glucose/GDP-mannose dehydrogenase family protein [Nocardioides sp. TF02-7]